MQKLKYIAQYIKGNSIAIIFSIIFANIVAIFATLNPILVKYGIDIIIGKNEIDQNEFFMIYVDKIINIWTGINSIIQIGIFIFCFALFQGIFSYFKERLANRVSQRASKRAREKLFKKIEYLPYNYHVNSNCGDVIQRCTSDIETVQDFVSEQLSKIGEIIFTLIYVLIIMSLLNIKYMLISIILLPIIFAFTLNFFMKIQKVFKEVDETEGRLTNVVQESITGIRVVKAFSAEKMEIERFDKQNSDYKDRIYDLVVVMSKFWSVSDFLCMTQFSLVIVAGVFLAMNNVVSVGTVIAFSSYAGMLIWPIRQFGQIAASMGQALVSLKRINEILEEKSESYSDGDKKPEVNGNIKINNLTFDYTEGKKIIDNVSLSIKRGQTVAFMGATGCGKSTIAHILLRLYDYKKGSIKIDDTELSEIDRKWIRENISIVLQEPYLFARTIKDNIKMGRIEADDEEIKNYSKSAVIHDSIDAFKDGYNTMIGEKGITLSGGQKQRVAIARALIKRSPILIFDDSLSALDTNTDSKIRKALREDNENRTTIIISHRITSVINADIIYVLENGKIAEQGNHYELIENEGGIYKKIYEIQNNSYNEELA
ncbi:MAG: ABC transporter ATP-binding protein [Clostridiales bacterium]